MIIDCHVHTFTKKQINGLLKSMDKNKIEKAISIYWPFEAWMDEKTPGICETWNNLKIYKNIFLEGSLKVINKNFRKDLLLLEKMAQKREIIGIKLYPGYEHFYPTEKKVFPIYELCIEYNIPVIFHSGDTEKNQKKALLKYAHPLHLNEVAVKFPDLKVVVSHLGYPWINEVALLAEKHENVYSDFSALVVGKKKFQKNEFKIEKRHLEEVFTMLDGTEKIMFGTDYPVFDQELHVKLVNMMKPFLSNADLENIKWKNASRLFRI